jgi:REP element-mobilizing transposase RayT
MPKARFLAPWHQPDLIAALEAEGLSVKELAALRGKPAIYHCVSRVVNRDFVLGDDEREQFVRYMRDYERFCGLRVLAFCVMSNHFHILLEVPAAPEERGADWSDERLLDHLSGLYSKQQMGALRWELEHYRKQKNTEAAEAFRERYFRRMWDLSQFMKTLKQRFTRWFNKHHGRKGTLWEERFKSVLVEDGHAARTMAAYIDLNPVRAGMVDDPKDYRWCSYAEAMAGKTRSREGLQRVMYEADAAELAEEIAVEELISWRKAAYHYRQILYMAVNRDDPNLDPEDAPQLTETDALLCRMRELIDGVALGTGPFIENIFGWYRDRFSEGRKSGARKLKGMRTSLRTLRDLKVDPPPD